MNCFSIVDLVNKVFFLQFEREKKLKYERGGNLQDVLSTITPTEFKVKG
jgi:hypothetical protein